MKLKAMGNFLLVRVEQDTIQEKTKGGILLPDEYLARAKGGCQIYEVLSVGPSAFDDQPPDAQKEIGPGTRIVTARYPGHAVDVDISVKDEDVHALRVIADTEVHAIVSEEGVEVMSNG